MEPMGILCLGNHGIPQVFTASLHQNQRVYDFSFLTCPSFFPVKSLRKIVYFTETEIRVEEPEMRKYIFYQNMSPSLETAPVHETMGGPEPKS